MFKKFLLVIWTLPNTLLGMTFGLLGLLFGGRIQFVRGCVEFYGGLVAWILRRLPNNPAAMTIGHTIIGRTDFDLLVARDHEHVHVRQYERWGILFIPAYFLASGWMWWKGKNPYWDNPFEVEAYGIARPDRNAFSKMKNLKGKTDGDGNKGDGDATGD